MQLYYLQRANYNDTMTILNDENINVLFAPASYKFRKLEYTSAFRVTIDSLTLHNKLYFHELDSKSHLAVKELPETHRGVDEPYKSIDEVTAYYRREISMVLAKGQGFWFFDMLGGWFNDPELMQEFERLKALSEDVRKHERKSLSEVAMFVDLESNYYLGSHINYEVTEMQLNNLNKMGLPWDSYVTEDLLHPEFAESNYKLMIFVNLFKPSEAIKEKLTELRKKGVSFLFFHAPGYISENGFSIDGMKELSSISLKRTDVKNTAVICVDSNEVYDFPPPPDSYYQNEYVHPSFCADDKDCEVWGEYEENGEPAFVVKYRDDGSFDAFSNSYPMPDSQLKKLALKAGAFEYLDSCEPVYMSSAVMGIYSYTGGTKKVKWKEPVKIREYFTNEIYDLSPNGTEINFKPKETKVFLVERQ